MSSAVTSMDASIRAERDSVIDDLSGAAARSVRRSGVIAAALFIVLLLLAIFVPIASGTLANGQLVVDGERKVVQHGSGGIVSSILVSEGDMVTEGQVVLRLNAIQAGAAAGVVNSQIDALRAEEAVRMAEATDRRDVEFPKELLGRQGDPNVAAVLAAESAAFSTRAALARSDQNQLQQQLQQIDQSISAAISTRDSQAAQAKLLQEELLSLQPLLEKGLALKSRVLGLERSLAEANGQIAASEAEQRRLAAKSLETKTLRDRVGVDRRAQAAEALRKIRADLSEVLERQVAVSDTLERTDIRSPIDGKVMALRVTTVGGVVEPGQALMEVVPQGEQLMVRARITPKEADDVHPGLPATVRLMAGGSRSPPSVRGVVDSVSADALNDPRNGDPYFEARVSVSLAEAMKAPRDVIAPGLPAEVLIGTGSQTMFDYLFSPVEHAMFRAMRDK